MKALARQALATWRSRTLLAFLALFAVMHCASAEDTVGARLAAAERYVQVVDMQAIVSNLLAGVAYKIPVEKREAFLKQFKQELSRSRMEAIMVNAMVQVYRADELNAAADFYSSPQGQAILRKSPQFINAAMPAMEAEMDKVLQTMGISKK